MTEVPDDKKEFDPKKNIDSITVHSLTSENARSAPYITGKEVHPLQSVTAALLECVTALDVVATVIERGVVALGAEAGLVVLTGENASEQEPYLDIVGASGYAEEVITAWRRFPLSARLPLSDAVREQTPLFFVGRADMEARYPAMFQQGPLHTVKASASLPLVARGLVFGGLHFSFIEERDVFTESDRNFLMELARQCALALDRSLLLSRLKEERAVAQAAHARQLFLARASALLGESLNYKTRLEALVRLCVPELADWVGVDVLGEDEELVRLAVAHRIPACEDTMREMQKRYPPQVLQSPNTLTVIQTGERFFFPHITPELIEKGAVDAEHAQFLKRVGVRSVLCLPIAARGKNLGAIVLGMGPAPVGSDRLFTEETVELVEEVARRAGVAMDNARLYEQAQREIAERRSAESALQASEARYRLVTDTIPQIIWGANSEGWVDFIHPRIEAYTGIPAEEIVQTGWLSVVHPDDHASATQRWLQSLRTGEFYETEFRLVRADGKYSWHMASALPVRGAEGDIRRWFGTLTDIEDRRRLQEQVEAERATALANQRHFLREMLFGMTEGHLRLCDNPEELPEAFFPASEPIALTPQTLRSVRTLVETEAQKLHFVKERTQELVTAASEAAMNAVKHANVGVCSVHIATDTETIQVWVRDKGEGIAEHLIHRAVESGWTTGGFGQGFHLMWKMCDRLYLLTQAQGTTVVLEMDRTPPKPVWLEAIPEVEGY